MIFLIASIYPVQKCLPAILTSPSLVELLPNSNKQPVLNLTKANKLTLNIAKTDFMVISTRQTFLAENCSEINIHLDGHPICRVENAKSLGLIIDDRLSWPNYIKELCRKLCIFYFYFVRHLYIIQF